MSLLKALLETINQEWASQESDINGEYDNVLAIAYIPHSLAKAIENEGNEVPKEFNPNAFNFDEDGDYCTVEIKVCTGQDSLIDFYYE
ncbi:hypothetical protein [Bacillus sp. AG4(2022)]|uniref:hypothetical protein n=1 Tax=Bacillus sp. AG4(2022) TaxID=2962594 RepID=UPI00288257CF|nr:hypothetical protein [Bacillus sp. AG4(2022)]MDT0160445.1 hypothetical protein [Bacillus sp. AG4(2022)]